jgi:hypothetical protein
MNAASVAKKVEFSRRRENVPFFIYQEVAPLEPEEQEKWIEIAVAEKLTCAELRTQMRLAKRSRLA